MSRPILEHNRTLVAISTVFSGIITGNTVPNTLQYDANGKTTILTDKNNITRGGLGGLAIQPIALDHTQFCAERMLGGKIAVGCGGIGNGNDVKKYIRAGATLVQINSAFREAGEDPAFITNILVDLLEAQQTSGRVAG